MQFVISRKSILALVGSLSAALGSLGGGEDRLIKAAQNGDRRAFETLQSSYSKTIRSYISRRVEGPEGDDVYQDAWIAAWTSIERFQRGSSLKAWLLMITSRKIQDYWRRELTKPKTVSFEDREDLAGVFPQELRLVEMRSVLSSFWNSCTADQKELLRLYYGDGLTLQEVSVVRNCNLNTVKYQFYRLHASAAEMLPKREFVLGGSEVTA